MIVKQRSHKFLLTLFVTGIILITSVLVIMHYLKQEVNYYLLQIANNQNIKFDQKINIEKIKIVWQGFSPLVKFQKIVIKDQQTNLNKFKAEQGSIKINLMDIFFNKKIKIANLKIIGAELNLTTEDFSQQLPIIGFIEKDLGFKTNLELIDSKLVVCDKELKIVNLSANIQVNNLDQGWHININKVGLNLADAQLQMSASLEYVDQKIKNLVTEIKTQSMSLATAYKYLPVELLDPKLRVWLLEAFTNKQGEIDKVVFNWKDDKFMAEIFIRDTELNYHPDWPKLSKLTGIVKIDNSQIYILAEQGMICDVAFDSVTARINNWHGSKPANLDIAAKIKTDLTHGLDFLLHSPLKYLGKAIANLQPKGDMFLDLGLGFTLAKKLTLNPKINGQLTVNNGEVNIKNRINLEKINGEFRFTEKEFYSNNKVKFRLKDLVGLGSGLIEINKKNKLLNLQISASATGDYIKTVFPEIKDLVNAEVSVFKIETIIDPQSWIFKEVKVDSDFVGTAIKLKYDLKNQTIVIAGKDMQGQIILAKENMPLRLDFERLKINTGLQALNEKKYKLGDPQFPLIIFSCNEVTLNNKWLGKVNFDLLPRTYGYDVTNLMISNHDFNFQGNISTQSKPNQQTNFSGNIVSNNLGELFSDWGLGDSVHKGNGNIYFMLSWNDKLENFKLVNADGDINISFENGQLLGINPGLGRIIGLLNLETIKRRMQLNFSDLLGSGFAFDRLDANLKLDQGVLHTDNILIDGPTAKINLTGKAWIASKTVDLKMQVSSKASSSLPLAAALAAGNPAIGAALWLADKAVLMPKANKDVPNNYKYYVKGTWDKPSMQEIKASENGK